MYQQLRFAGSFQTKFPMPKSRKEQAQAIILIAIAIIFAGLFDPIREFTTMAFGDSADAQYIEHFEYRNQGPHSLVGVYAFKTDDGGTYATTSKVKHKSEAAIPKTAKVAWKIGEPQKAIVLRQGPKNYWTAFVGILLLACGIWLFKTKAKIA